jgi:hypothetical protein
MCFLNFFRRQQREKENDEKKEHVLFLVLIYDVAEFVAACLAANICLA